MVKNNGITKHAYAAGIIDGEGSIYMSRSHKSDKFKHPIISVTSTSYEVLLFLSSLYGGTICNQKTYKDHHKKAWLWKIEYDSVLDCLNHIYPFLLIHEKKRRADFLLKYYKKFTKRNGKYNKTALKNKVLLEYYFYHNTPPIFYER